ncbi:hypothetical protein HOO34_02555 [Aliarcobacter cryaerophilus]|uniref:DUF4760 domain-containing protein n=1 Tax=Aliarcobacter cryaerophilus TaxID=28198 RepID=A0A7G9LPT2_9BACT|nr:hypothetical protein [Aliarcobacter cryaerophilus]QNM90631.1 hypothetical protein HOO34_02555 [Aliarcobacter cryaerophilus]
MITYNIDLSTSFISLLGFCIAITQLYNLNKQFKISVENQRRDSLKIVLEIESQMASRKVEFDKIAREIKEYNLNKDISEEKVNILIEYFDTAKENYFNSIDRLCYCINKNYLDDRDWKVEYRNVLKDLVTNYEDDFNAATPYRNIKKINEKWQDE